MCDTKDNKDHEMKKESTCSDMSVSQKKEDKEDAELEGVRRL